MLHRLVAQLQNPDPQTRVETLCALVMVLETEALDLLRQMYESEPVPQVKNVVQWAGRQILAASQQGYSTTAAMRFAYRLDLAGQGPTHAEEQRRKLETEISRAKLRGNIVGKNLAGDLGDFATLAALNPFAAFGALATPKDRKTWIHSSGSNAELDGLKFIEQVLEEESTETKRAIVPPKPADTAIKIWLKKLANSEVQTRLTAARQLGDFNNSAALGPLGWAYARDTEPALRQKA